MSTVAALDNFRENLRKRCEKTRISQRELARRADVHFVTVNRILTGDMEPTVPLAERLAVAVGSTLEKILRDPA